MEYIFLFKQLLNEFEQKGEFYEKVSDIIIFSADHPVLRISAGNPKEGRVGYSRVHCLRGRGYEDKFYPSEHERRHIRDDRHRESLCRSGV